MSTPLVLTPTACQGKTWHPPVDLQYAAGQPLIPLHMWELAKAAASMPLALVRKDDEWQLVAVCGLTPGHNLFIGQGKWAGNYQPEWLASYPFGIYAVGDRGVVTFAQESGLLAERGLGEPFYDAQGQMLPAVATRVAALKENFPKYQKTGQLLKALAAAGVITPWPKSLTDSLGMTIEGLHMIDERALAELDDAVFLKLRKAQALAPAYAINLSLPQAHLLTRLARINPPASAAVDLDELFGDDDDSLSFDFN